MFIYSNKRHKLRMSEYQDSYQEKRPHISNIASAILPLYQENCSNWMVILSTPESTNLDGSIKWVSRRFILAQIMQNLDLDQSQGCYLHTICLGPLKHVYCTHIFLIKMKTESVSTIIPNMKYLRCFVHHS